MVTELKYFCFLIYLANAIQFPLSIVLAQRIVNFSSLTAGDRHCSLSHVGARSTVLSNPLGWFFPGSQVLSSHACSDEHSAEYSRGSLRKFPEFSFHAALSSLFLCSANSSFLGLSELTVPSSQLRGLTSFIFCLLRITVLHCLMSSVLKTILLHILSYFVVVISSRRINLGSIISSLLEAGIFFPYIILFKPL